MDCQIRLLDIQQDALADGLPVGYDDSGHEIDGCDETKFIRKTLAGFLDRISNLITPPHDGDAYNVVFLGRVADHLGLRKLSFGRFVQVMIAGFPRPVIEREGLPGRLSRFWFASMKSMPTI